MLIKQLSIFVPSYNQTIEFYKNVIGLNPIRETTDLTSFSVGKSNFTIHRDDAGTNYYHFAFNIPPNLFNEAKTWTEARVTLSKEDNQNEIEFVSAKAKSFYFEDPSGNIVEFIARETTPAAKETDFKSGHLLEISEIGVATDQMRELINQLQAIKINDRNDEAIHYETYLNFFGDYHDGVYIILSPIGRRWIFSDKQAIHTPVLIETDRGTFTNI
ncbi:glyoxalase/bleomycin resistance/dioxygenase family protein [Bacillus sp. JCM 19041]|uniref:glyoxalase/bleomycin resistance/dioxygenase family protein n=1 Tax=Bacillus sp. JCM 19041 TaxID=1460637 RepID=UPI0006D0D6EB